MTNKKELAAAAKVKTAYVRELKFKATEEMDAIIREAQEMHRETHGTILTFQRMCERALRRETAEIKRAWKKGG